MIDLYPREVGRENVLKQLNQLNGLQSHHTLRLSYLYHGNSLKDEIPPMEIFTKPISKGYKIPYLSSDRVAEMASFNSFGYDIEKTKFS